MSDSKAEPPSSSRGLFTAQPEERSGGSMLVMAGAIAVLVVVLALGLGLMATHQRPKAATNAVQALDAYAPDLVFSDLQMSESSALSAVKVTYLDGHIRNKGDRTVKGATVQVMFGNDVQLPPQVETLPMTLIRTHEPYVDVEPVRAEPIKPGQEREFRLIFENVGANWNQQLPQIRVVGVE